MSDELEYRYTPVELDGRVLSGVVMRYGEIATGAPRPEKFLPGSLSFGDVILNVMHDRERPIARTPETLFLDDSPESLILRADVPETREGTDTLLLVKKRVLTGLSVEFRAIRERVENGVRVIEKALLSGIGVVDRAAYAGSILEARAKRPPLFRVKTRIPYKKALACKCQAGVCQNLRFTEDSFKVTLGNETEDVVVINKRFDNPITSRSRGGVKLKNTEEALEVELELPDTEEVRKMAETSESVPLYLRTYSQEQKVKEISPELNEVESARLSALVIESTPSNTGWPVVAFEEIKEERKVHIWL